MKKCLVSFVMAVSLTALADSTRLGTLRLADAETFSSAAMKLGELSGSPLAGIMIAGGLARLPMGVEMPVYLEDGRPRAATGEAVACAGSADGALARYTSDALEAWLSIGDRGLDLDVRFPKAGGPFAAFGSEPLASDAFAFASEPTVVIASAHAANCGSVGAETLWSAVRPVLVRHGLLGDDYLSAATRADGTVAFAFDYPRASRYFASARASLASFDRAALMSELGSALKALPPPVIEGKAERTFLSAIGYSTTAGTIASRFAATFPESAERHPFSVWFFSPYSAFLSLCPAVLAGLPEAQREAFAGLVGALPPASAGGLGVLCWREGETLRLTLRVSADELHGIGSAFGVIAGAMQSM